MGGSWYSLHLGLKFDEYESLNTSRKVAWFILLQAAASKAARAWRVRYNQTTVHSVKKATAIPNFIIEFCFRIIRLDKFNSITYWAYARLQKELIISTMLSKNQRYQFFIQRNIFKTAMQKSSAHFKFQCPCACTLGLIHLILFKFCFYCFLIIHSLSIL